MSSISTSLYSPSVGAGNYIFVSGQAGVTNPESGKDNEVMIDTHCLGLLYC